MTYWSVGVSRASVEPTAEPMVETTVATTVGPAVPPRVGPTVQPRVEPTVEIKVGPTVETTVGPTVEVTVGPAVPPRVGPTVQPRVEPTVEIKVGPTVETTVGPTVEVTVGPAVPPRIRPTMEIKVGPTVETTVGPTVEVTVWPTVETTMGPTVEVIVGPAVETTVGPTVDTTVGPAVETTVGPTVETTVEPTMETRSTMDGPGVEDMGAKASLAGGVVVGSGLSSSPTLESIQEAYEGGRRASAGELVQRACCVECSDGSDGRDGSTRIDAVRLLCVATQHGDLETVRYLLGEARVPMPQDLSDDNPAILAAHYGHASLAAELLDSLPGSRPRPDLLNWMLATACQRGHLEVVRLLVQDYHANTGDCAIQSDQFAVITGMPLYASAEAGNQEVAAFLLQHGAGFSSYTLMDHPGFCKGLLRQRLQEVSEAGDQALDVGWRCLGLPWLELDWLVDVWSRIARMDLSGNELTALPSVVPWGLVRLRTLDLSANLLKELPPALSSQEVMCVSLRHLNLSQNQLTTLPAGVLHLTRLQRLSAAKNQVESLFDIPPGTNWIGLRKLEELDVSDNRLTSLPSSIMHSLKSLSSLNVGRNKLTSFPDPWACPLKQCKASSNLIESLPNTISLFWRTQLQEVDFSVNSLKELPSYIFELEALISLRLCRNQISSLPAPNKWKCSHLRTLDLSHNQLGKTEENPKTRRLAFLTTWNRRDPDPVCPIEFPVILRDSLEVLFLNDNQLECVPQSVCGLASLNELYLANNPGIRELPSELGQLSNLWQLDMEELNISNVPQEVRKEGPMSVLAYLRAHLRRAEPCRLLKMLMVGPPRQGKTALLHALQTGHASPFSSPGSSISTTAWPLERPRSSRGTRDCVYVNVWDIGGPASMSTVNQCFFTDKALYVVIWNLALGEEAVSSLQTWLLSIEARAPNSAVVVVGTHLDLIDTKFRTERVATLRAYILALCRTPSGSRATGYPDITWKHLHEVSCKTLEGLDGLKTLLYQVVSTMKDSGGSACSNRLLGRLIPKSYLMLQEAIIAERERRDAEDEVQYLTDKQLETLVEQNTGSDIRDYEDLQTAIKFLIETGTLLHFPDTSHGLCMLYFLCPVWLSGCLERIVHLKSSRSVARNGVINTEDLRMLLVGTGFTKQTEEQYFQFLAKFEIALPVTKNSYLLPHLLPPKPGMDIHCFRQQTHNTLQRLFKMSFVPAGFWERFIARMLISLTNMDLQSFEGKRGSRSQDSRRSVMYSFAAPQMKNRCSTFRVRRSQTIYWKEGLLVTFDGGYLSVESSDLSWKRKKSGGIKIICQSEMRDFSAMAFITDHVNSLIDQWFPALTASESDGSLLMEQFAPCPLCASLGRQRSPRVGRESRPGAERGTGDGKGSVHYFNMEDCVLAAMEGQQIACPRHPEHPVPLQELVPELFMTDFPARLFLEKAKLECPEQDSDILGQGGSGTIIYRARYRDQPVAIKRFFFKRCRQRTITTDTDTMMKHLQAVHAFRSFSEFRQEASILHALQHPCIVPLVGISIHPLCFALQLAPLGSLNAILKERLAGSRFLPLGHMLTLRVAYQIAAGLAYLHRKDIIFCDLKSDNILVWSLEVGDPVNVKLSDYGISRQAFHEGALGVEGTPGYQAPEIRPGVVYDEKVDMFSYGMVLYELLSGQRPILGQHQLQVARKLAKGVRPVLGSPHEVQFQCLQDLMGECWDTKPEKRPLAMQCVRQMQEPSFPCLRYLLPCESHCQLFLSHLQGYSAVFWDGDKDNRHYSLVNVEKGLVEVKRMSCPGPRLSCQMKMDNTLWLATEEQEVFIYSLKEMCPLNQPQKKFSCPAVITCLFPVAARDQSLPRVFAGMSDGLVAVYTVVEDVPMEGETYLCSHTLNKTVFGLPDTDPRQKAYPVRAMALVSAGSEVWISNGPGLLVVDSLSLRAVRRLDPYSGPCCVVALASGPAVWGDETVWTLDDRSNTLLLYDATSYQLCASYSCGDINPMRDVFPVRRPARVAAATPPDPEEQVAVSLPGEHPCDGEVTLIYSPEAGMQILQNQDSLTDYCSMDSPLPSLGPQGSESSGLGDLSLLTLRPTEPTNPIGPGLFVASEQPDQEMDQADRGQDQADRGKDQADQGMDQADRGQDQADRGLDLADRGQDQADRGKDQHPDRGQDQLPEWGQDWSQDQQLDSDQEANPEEATMTSDPTLPYLQAFTVMCVNGTLWVPRHGGDILVIELQTQAEEMRGRVVAVLSPPGRSSLGTLEEAAHVAKDTVVCGFRCGDGSGDWCLCVWRGWGGRELEVFHRSYEELGRMEASVRRRR